MRAFEQEKSDNVSTASLLLYLLLGIAVGVMAASGIMIYRFYTATNKNQQEYEKLALLSAATEEISEPIIVDKTKLSDDMGFDMIATGESKKKSGFQLLMPVDDPTTAKMLKEVNEKPKHEEKTEEAESSEPLVIRQSQEGMCINFPKLYGWNPDIKGWIRIEGTAIDYPVVQSLDNEYYLDKNFYKQEASAGCLFLDYSNEIDKDKNLVVYGHNMGRSSRNMFSSLLNYYEPSYYQTHRYILFDTVYGAGKWEIVSVFRYNIERINEFNYTQQQFGSKTEYQHFVRKIKELSLYDTGVTVADNEQLLTLSTCDRETYGATGRCVVVAKKK